MLILLRTQVDRTDKTPVTARCARVGGLCGGHICPQCGQFRGFTRAFQTQRKTAGGRCRMKKARRFKGNRGVPTKNTR